MFRHYNLINALCLPADCNANEVELLLRTTLKNHATFRVVDKARCQKKDDISYATRFKKLTRAQLIALCFLFTMTALVLLATILHFLRVNHNLTQFSAITTTTRLLDRAVPSGSHFVTLVEVNKLIQVQQTVEKFEVIERSLCRTCSASALTRCPAWSHCPAGMCSSG